MRTGKVSTKGIQAVTISAVSASSIVTYNTHETKEMLQPCLIYLHVISLVARRVARSGRYTTLQNADTLSRVLFARLARARN